MKRFMCMAALGLAPLGCGEEGTNEPGPEDVGRIQTLDQGGGVFATQVDASDPEAWVYFDLDGSAEVEVLDLGQSTDWDLAFRRSNIKVNGGHSGPGDVRVAALPHVAFEGLDATPVALFEQDAPTTGEVDPDRPSFIDDDGTDFVFGRPNAASTNGWFDYDVINHVLSGADVTFIVESTEGTFFKLRFIDYYDSQGSSGIPTFLWAEVGPPPGPRTLVVDASSREAFTYLSLETTEVVSVTDPANDSSWDLAFRRTLVRTNSGISGPGWGGARETPGLAFTAVESSDTIGFRPDVLVPPPGPPVPVEEWQPANDTLSSWFDYDPATRAVSPRDTLFVVRDASGAKHKVEIAAWQDGRFEIETQPIPPKPDLRSITLEASADTWTYFDARLGEVVEVEDPETSRAWDLAFRGAEVQLNGGAHGPGEAAAVAVDAASIDEVVVVPDEGFSADVDLAAAEAGSIHVLRLADGTFAKLAIVRAEGGEWELDYAYAGPGRRSFR